MKTLRFQSPSMGLIDSYSRYVRCDEYGCRQFQSPSMGLIDSYAVFSSRPLTSAANSFNPLQWGLLILTTPESTPTEEPAQVSIPFNGAY